ncbi:hypothetical protein BRC94_10855 [Halobacteriales archaeon QS_5_70_17]|nr:MAG: hypothetical protein BRC94_10855 [Halobacteriales archaeon QS_5_70_17]
MSLPGVRPWWSLAALAATPPAVADWYLLSGAADPRVYLAEVALPLVAAAELVVILAATRGEWRWASRPAHAPAGSSRAGSPGSR